MKSNTTNTSQTFFNDQFHLGERRPILITDGPPCPYDLPNWIAALTAGEELAVLWYTVRNRAPLAKFWDDDEADALPVRYPTTLDMPLVVIPDFGLWVVEPIYRYAADAFDRAKEKADALAANFGVPANELAINIALLPVVDTPIDVSGVDPTFVFGLEDYAHLRAAFIGRRQRFIPAEILQASLEFLPHLGLAFDVKETLWDMDPDIPQWLADRTNLEVNPDPIRLYKTG